MNGLIDIHSHILPLVDDGAESVEMALLMLKKAAEEGIEKTAESKAWICYLPYELFYDVRPGYLRHQRTVADKAFWRLSS